MRPKEEEDACFFPPVPWSWECHPSDTSSLPQCRVLPKPQLDAVCRFPCMDNPLHRVSLQDTSTGPLRAGPPAPWALRQQHPLSRGPVPPGLSPPCLSCDHCSLLSLFPQPGTVAAPGIAAGTIHRTSLPTRSATQPTASVEGSGFRLPIRPCRCQNTQTWREFL